MLKRITAQIRKTAESRPVFLAAALFVLALSARLYYASQKETFHHDEVIGYLAATVNQEHYFTNGLRDRWVRNSEWLTIFDIGENRYNFKKIQQDLVEYDMHPPLYFWLLHTAVCQTGISLFLNSLINIFFFSASFWMLYAICRRVFTGHGWPACAMLIWALSPVTISTTVFIRQYEMLGTFALAAVLILLVYFKSAVRGRAVCATLYALCILGGMMTAYQFSLHIASLSLLVFLYFLRSRNWKHIAIIAGVTLAGLALYFLAHPSFFSEVSRGTAGHFSADRFGERFSRTVYTIGKFFPFRIGTLILLVLVNIFSIFQLKPDHVFRPAEDTCSGRLMPSTCILVVLASNTALFLFMYLSFKFPKNAMNIEQFSFIWPFFAVLFTYCIMRLDPKLAIRSAAVPVTVFLLGTVFGHVSYIGELDIHHLNGRSEPYAFRFDFNMRGHIARFLYHMPPDSLMYVPSSYKTDAEELLRSGREADFKHTLFYILRQDDAIKRFSENEALEKMKIAGFTAFTPKIQDGN